MRNDMFFFENPLFTTEEVAKYLRVDVVTIRRMVARGELSAHRIANEYRFTKSDLRDYLERSIVRPDASPETLAEQPDLAEDLPDSDLGFREPSPEEER